MCIPIQSKTLTYSIPRFAIHKSPTTNEKQKTDIDTTYKLKNAQNENMSEIIRKRNS